MREKLLSFIISERRNSLNIVVWLENWMKTVEASIAVHPERYDKKESGDICVQIGDSETSAKHSVTFPKKLASFESKSKALMDQGETNFANKWYQTSKELKSRTVQTEVEKILVDISCQVEDFNNGTSASENSATFSSTNAQNEVVIVQENAGTRYMGFSCQALDQEGRRKMKDIFTGNGSFTLYTFCQTEGIPGSTDVRSKYPTFFSASMQTKYSNEYTEVVSQIGGIQCADHLNEIDVRTDGRSHARTASTSIEFGNEIVLCAKPALVIQNRNSISERLKNAFRTLRLLEEGIEVEETQCDVDIRNNVQMITASNSSPCLMHRLHHYLRNLRYRRNSIRLILRYLLVFYFILLHVVFFRCNIF